MILCSSRAWISLHQIQKSYNIFICQIRIISFILFLFYSFFKLYWGYETLNCAIFTSAATLGLFCSSALLCKASFEVHWQKSSPNSGPIPEFSSIQNFHLSIFYCTGNPPCLKNIYFQNMFQLSQLCSHWVVFWHNLHVQQVYNCHLLIQTQIQLTKTCGHIL